MGNDLNGLRTELIPEQTTPQVEKHGSRRFAIDVLETLLLALLLFMGINALSARIRVEGSSMEPTLHNGEFLIVNKLAYRLGSPKIGDVVVFHPPRDLGQEYIKRVIGLPGDTVAVSNGKVSVNGQVLDEPYIEAPPNYQMRPMVVPSGTLFVLGDNRNNSSDSHTWGPALMNEVVGKAVFIYWPPSNWGLVEHTSQLAGY
jgi:signal peptidase I